MAIFTAQCDVASLTQDNSVNGKLLGAFLDANQPTLPDAEKELRAGIVQAKRENKKMLVEVCSPGCGPCMDRSPDYRLLLTSHKTMSS